MPIEDREITTERLRRLAKLLGQYDARKSGREIGEIVAKIERLQEDLDNSRGVLSDIEEKIEKWELPRRWEPPREREPPREWEPPSIEWEEYAGRRNLRFIGAAVGILLIVVLLIGSVGVLGGIMLSGGPANERYGFETGKQGWQYQTWQDSMAITAVSQNTTRAKYGSASLQCMVSLVGVHDNNSKGEAWVDMQLSPPAGITAPVNLSNATVSVWVNLPDAAAGDPTKPNGIQIFFKDDNWNNSYSSWKNIGTDIPTGQWAQITVNVPTEQWAWPLPGDNENLPCNFTRVRALGVKIGAGGGSTATFSGMFFIDGVGVENAY